MQKLPDGFRLRLATVDDAEALQKLITASVEAIFPAFYDAEQTASGLTYIGVLDLALVQDGTYFVVQAPDSSIAACGGWSRRDKLFNGAQATGTEARLLDPATEPARVRAMFVHGDWTRRGLGTRILEACEDAARAEGFTELALMATMPGLQLYRTWGFTNEDPQDLVMPDGVVVPGVAMTRRIS
ncbi:GNAT family N-acetyltransferase [Sporichthya brevicatena]|uniref:GNAT family N-acetyltransferase n=1 Tax=Sporichthya brevicatena TaxID=171442 RepID=A0ABN1G617_9ACTN